MQISEKSSDMLVLPSIVALANRQIEKGKTRAARDVISCLRRKPHAR